MSVNYSVANKNYSENEDFHEFDENIATKITTFNQAPQYGQPIWKMLTMQNLAILHEVHHLVTGEEKLPVKTTRETEDRYHERLEIFRARKEFARQYLISQVTKFVQHRWDKVYGYPS